MTAVLPVPSDADDPDGRVASYDFELPPESIAQRPAERRDASRLLVLRPGSAPADGFFSDLPDTLEPGDLLVRNDTRVFPARLVGRRPGGGRVELLLLHPDHTPNSTPRDDATATASADWLAFARPAGRLRPGMTLAFGDGDLLAVVGERGGGLDRGEVRVRLLAPKDGEARDPVMAAIERRGRVPLPPYIVRPDGESDPFDRERYQTLYATAPGAVAAPTAGLHFTPEVDEALRRRGVRMATLTQHVGAGTFRPMTVERLADHPMHAEWYRVPGATRAAVRATRAAGGRVVAVGTTTARALESAFGAEAEETAQRVAVPETGATALKPNAAKEGIREGDKEEWTSLFIRPGYAFRVVEGLITNFHLPRSSLLALVSALAGREALLAAYRGAIARGYRFYSYGDAMLVFDRKGKTP